MIMENEPFQTDSAIWQEEQIIQEITPDSTSHYKTECPCGCHLLADYSEKSYVIVPMKENGSGIDVVKLPIFKIKKQPKKSLLGYAKCKMISYGKKNSEHHFPIPIWSVQHSDMAVCLTCKEKQNKKVKYESSSQTEPIQKEEPSVKKSDSQLQKEEPPIKKSESRLQNEGPSLSRRQSSVREQIPEEPEEEQGRISYEEYRTGFGQWYPFFINKPQTRRRKDE